MPGLADVPNEVMADHIAAFLSCQDLGSLMLTSSALASAVQRNRYLYLMLLRRDHALPYGGEHDDAPGTFRRRHSAALRCQSGSAAYEHACSKGRGITTLQIAQGAASVRCLAVSAGCATVHIMAPHGEQAVQLQQSSRVTCGHLAQSAPLVVTGAVDGTAALHLVPLLDEPGLVRLRSCRPRAEVDKKLKGHKDAISAVTLHRAAASTLAVTGSRDTSLRVWRACADGCLDGSQVAVLRGQGDPVTDARSCRDLGPAWESERDSLVSTSHGRIMLWDLSTCQCAGAVKTGHSIGAVLPWRALSRSGCHGGCVWYSHTHGVACVDVRERGSRVVAAVAGGHGGAPHAAASVYENQVAVATRGHVYVCDIRALRAARGTGVSQHGGRGVLHSIQAQASALHVDRVKLVVASAVPTAGEAVTIWDVVSGERTRALPACSSRADADEGAWVTEWVAPEEAHGGEAVLALAVSGAVVASGTETGLLCVRDFRRGGGGMENEVEEGDADVDAPQRGRFWSGR